MMLLLSSQAALHSSVALVARMGTVTTPVYTGGLAAQAATSNASLEMTKMTFQVALYQSPTTVQTGGGQAEFCMHHRILDKASGGRDPRVANGLLYR